MPKPSSSSPKAAPTKTAPPRTAPTETIVEHVIESLRRTILDGRLAPGARVVVADVAEAHGVSVGPVREAIRRLTGEGLLEFTPHRGASVRTYSPRDVREIFQVREALEGYAAKLAAENIHRADYAERMRACRARLHESIDASIAELSDARQAFHDLLYEFAGNDALKDSAKRLTFPLHRQLFNKLTGEVRIRASLKEHDEIIDAILASDGVSAERAMRAHLRNGAVAVCEAIEQVAAAARAADRKEQPS